ncbi:MULTISPECIES: DUF4176 domain-containing protein [Priestia]|uniref:DUF4176 domain-containing protein n=1 Tax=Priestia aryabhattai TaxID=412384 RepID=A0ABD7WWM3_PRIAR|nr:MULTISPECIES: DUF4176 domain-containing protein [Priestia]MBY0030414.1 DUF4176 domain-containing protein [Priestia aryabhattai]PVE66949.1 DUF4176 domain-containing protein [Priestia megaterium]PVE80366.1 DUF4176 domain-containing protein [Priestia megaterium]PVE86578.1 DUF4176 domain-containing protein [Priestia megaterium]PVF00090.1 DUF4176 domain-containing protein [Priestia megaterium]
MKNIKVILCITALAFLALAGCSTNTSSENKNDEEKKTEEKTSIQKENASQPTEKDVDVDTSQLLPIGTVVKLKNIKKPVMVYGQNQRQESSQKIFDYVSVPYPEGNISSDYNVFFDRSRIEKVLYQGYDTPEGEKFLEEQEKQLSSKEM